MTVRKTEPDKILAFLAMLILFFAMVVLLVLRVNQPISFLLALFITCLVYYLKKGALRFLFLEDRGSPSTFMQSHPHVLFWSVFGNSLFSLAAVRYSENIYQRPYWLLVCFVLPASLVVLQIILKAYKLKGGELALFLQILILLLSISFSSIITFPFNGSDTWAHLFNANVINQTLSFEGLQGGYKNYPLFPLTISFLTELTGASASQVARILVLFFSSLCLFMIFILSKEYYGSTQRALIAMFVLAGSKWYLYWSTLVVSMATAVLLFTAFYVFISLKLFTPEKGINGRVLSVGLLLLAAMSPFYHPVGSLAIAILCVCFFLTDLIFFPKEHKVKGSNILIIVSFVVVVTLTQWIYYGETFAIAMKSLFVAIFQETPYSIALANTQSDLFTYALDNINFYLLICLALVEIFRQIGLRSDRLSLFSGITGIFFVIFAYSAQLINFQALLPYRWLLFGSLLFILPAVNVIAAILRKKAVFIKGLVYIGFVIYFFSGIANKDINRDHPLYGIETAQRYEITFPEYAGLVFAENELDAIHRPIKVDYRMWDYLKLVSDSQYLVYWNEYELGNRDMVFAFREVYKSYRAAFLGDSIDNFSLNVPNLNQFYDSGDLHWFDWIPGEDIPK